MRAIATGLGVVFMSFTLATASDAQRVGRRAVTLDLLSEHPLFFHGEEIIIQSDALGESVLTYLVNNENRLLAVHVTPPPPGVIERLEVIGTFFDVGRLDPGDPRAVGQPFERLAESLLDKRWPGVGELLVVVAASSRLITETADATLRTVTLNPTAYLDDGVTVIGRFRGRNLYGDLPDSPGESRYDFVLTSADAAVWVVGREPKGDGFELDVQARVDTGRWLEVTGSVRVHEGMVIIDAGEIRLADPPETTTSSLARVEPREGPPPDVIFTTPLEGDTDVPIDTMIRVQFSRDMTPDSFEGRVRVGYALPGAGAPTDALPPILFETRYRALNRVLEIRLEQPLEPFRSVQVELVDGITASDGAVLAPWSMSFLAGR